ncbi:MAG: DUF2339 domain-containing protein, partial [Chitinophagaceae bacterium]|nr:DUF2339 domain-containing protein [Chitinophagaceae bacterium]
MQPTPEQISQLKRELATLSSQQNVFQQRIQQLAETIRQLEVNIHEEKTSFKVVEEPLQNVTASEKVPDLPPVSLTAQPEQQVTPRYAPLHQTEKKSFFEKLTKDAPTDFEKFIGENLISKIGIVILVIGVGIGTKYAIDKDLLSPLTRIILGYLLGGGLLAFGIKTKEKYEHFSAILVSGAMAVFYLITFAAFSFYSLIPQALAFGLMVVFTAFTVMTSLFYNRQWIALLALVGGYGIPFLLSNNTGRVEILFTYMVLLNAGILAVSIKKYWQTLYYSAFVLSWAIMLAWLINDYDEAKHFSLALLFTTLFFLLFYAVFLTNKLIEKKNFGAPDVIFLLLNSFIYYGIGWGLINGYLPAERFAGLFTLLNATIHFAVALTIYRMKLADKNLFYLVSGLVLFFITLAIPVQFDGSWVTLTWALEAALLFWIGRNRQVPFYERLSYPLMVLALFSQIEDWSGLDLPTYGYTLEKSIQPILNFPFVVSLLVCLAFGLITYISYNRKNTDGNLQETFRQKLHTFFGSIFPPAALLLLLYFTFRQELIHLWEIRYASKNTTYNYFDYFKKNPAQDVLYVWVLNYSLLFISCIGLFNYQWIKSKILTGAFFVLGTLSILSLLVNGLPQLGFLRDSALNPDPTVPGIAFNTAITLRYITLTCTGLLLFTKYLTVKSTF